MIITGCVIELAHSVLSRAMIITRPVHKVSKYAADFRGLLVVLCYDHTLPANISARNGTTPQTQKYYLNGQEHNGFITTNKKGHSTDY
jgi:hypothetical protein